MKLKKVLRFISLVLSLVTLLCGCNTQQSAPNNTGAFVLDDNTSSSSVPTSIPAGSVGTEQVNSSFKTFAGSWAEETTHWSCGGMILGVSVADNNLMLDCKYYSPAPESYIASFTETISLADIAENTVTISFEDDGWYHSGKVTVEFLEDSIMCLFYGIKFFGEGWTTWGFDSGEFTLYKNDQIHEEMKYTQEDFDSLSNGVHADPPVDPEPDNTPTYDTSKASGILAQSGLTEQNFRNICTYIGSVWDKNNAYSYAAGQEYHAQHSEEAWRINERTNDWNNYQLYGKEPEYYKDELKKSNSLDEFLNRTIYGPKGASILEDRSEELFKKMREYPGNYINQPFLLKCFTVDSDYGDTYCDDNYILYGMTTVVVDYRDDVNSPNILERSNYDMYVMFLGVNDYNGLVFALLSVDKCDTR